MAVVKSFFDVANIILEKKQGDYIPDKNCNQFMLNSYFSCDQSFVGIAHEMSKLKISDKAYFDCLYYGLPKIKKFIKWNATKAKKEQHIQYIMEYFKCSHETAKDYLILIDDKELKYIISYYEDRGLKK